MIWLFAVIVWLTIGAVSAIVVNRREFGDNPDFTIFAIGSLLGPIALLIVWLMWKKPELKHEEEEG